MFAVALIAVTSLGERKRGESQRTNIRPSSVPGVRFGVAILTVTSLLSKTPSILSSRLMNSVAQYTVTSTCNREVVGSIPTGRASSRSSAVRALKSLCASVPRFGFAVALSAVTSFCGSSPRFPCIGIVEVGNEGCRKAYRSRRFPAFGFGGEVRRLLLWMRLWRKPGASGFKSRAPTDACSPT